MHPYIEKAVSGALRDFASEAGPGNNNDLLFALAMRLLELAHTNEGYSESDAERDVWAAAADKGHDDQSTQDTLKSAYRRAAGKAATIPASAYPHAPQSSTGGYADLAAYAASRGVPASAYTSAGWADSTLYAYQYTDRQGKPATGLHPDGLLHPGTPRRAIMFTTDAGPRWRLLDGGKPKYWHPYGTHQEANKAWYGLHDALAMQAFSLEPLVLANGESSVIVAHHWGLAALCETGGGEKLTPPQMLQLLVALCPPKPDLLILIPADCDPKGHKSALSKADQYRAAGYTVRALDLNLGAKEDLADFCKLHQGNALAALLACADVAVPGQAATSQQGVVTQSQAIVDQLAALGYTFRLNLCGHVIEVNGQPIDDVTGATIRTRLRDSGWKRLGPIEDAYTAHAAHAAYHPVRDYLDSLVWDGQSHITLLSTYMRGNNAVVAYQDGTRRSLESVYLLRWLIGAVARVYEQAQNGMLVFTGKQGIGKSGLASWLCPPALRGYFLESPINPTDKDAQLRLMSIFLWEVGELDATTRRADVSALKHFISQQVVTVRRSYGRHDTRGPALASLIGTVNNQDFLADDSGNRRFYVLDLSALDWAYRSMDVAQVWAEAVARYKAGEPCRLLPEEQAIQAEANRGYMADSIIGDYIRKHFMVSNDPAHTLTSADVLDHLRVKGVPMTNSDRAVAIEIGRTMAALGVEKTRTAKGGRFYVGIMAV